MNDEMVDALKVLVGVPLGLVFIWAFIAFAMAM